MKIYTKTGDQGETHLLGGGRVKKNDFRIRVTGAIDELNAGFAVALNQALPPEVKVQIQRFQVKCFELGAEVSSVGSGNLQYQTLSVHNVTEIEKAIDAMETHLMPLRNFILPGGCPAASFLHLARAICRRLEIEMLTLNDQFDLRPEVLQWVNRLSDYLFVAARYCNTQANVEDVLWVT